MTYSTAEGKHKLCEDSDPSEYDWNDDDDEGGAADEIRNVCNGAVTPSRPFLPNNWQQRIPHNLMVLRAACDAAGLSGFLKLTNYDGPGPRVIHTNDLPALAASDPAALAGFAISTKVYQDEESLKYGRNPLGCALPITDIEKNWTPEAPGLSDLETMDLLRQHSALLAGEGLKPFFNPYESTPILYFASTVGRPIVDFKTNDGLPKSLDLLGNIGGGEQPMFYGSSDSDLHLSAAVFPLDMAPEDIIAAAPSPERVMSLSRAWEKAGCQQSVFENMGSRFLKGRGAEKTDFIVTGMVPRRAITLLAGERGIGKSTLAHELAVVASTPRDNDSELGKWLGQDVAKDRPAGVVALISGEDDCTVMAERLKILDPAGNAVNLFTQEGNASTLDAILVTLRRIPKLGLVIVDPARAFAEGSEDQSDRTSAFFDKFLSLARETGCAVLIVHHLGKNAMPRSLDAVVRSIRGSGVYVDRPRSVICMYRGRADRAAGTVQVGLGKWNYLRGDMAFAGAMPFIQDAVTLRHLPGAATEADDGRPDESGADSANGDGDVDQVVLTAFKTLTAAGHRITRTGSYGLYERRRLAPELAGFSRSSIRAALGRLVDSGEIEVSES